MAATGRHRRYQPSRLNRVSLTVTAGGAGLALPLIAAASAGAASADVWEKVAACESTGDWHINNGNGYFGGLQFSRSTWAAYGGTVYAPRADLATKDEQIAIAEKVLTRQGPAAWPRCSTRAGLTTGGAPSGIAPQSERSSQARAPKKQSPGEQKPEKRASEKQAQDEQARGKQASGTSAAGTARTKRTSAPTRPTTGPGRRDSYTVTRGDSLSAIAENERLPGGWQRLYAENRTVVGADPDLIFPGQRLSLDAARTRGTGHESERVATAGPGARPERAAEPDTKPPHREAEPRKERTEQRRTVAPQRQVAGERHDAVKPRAHATAPREAGTSLPAPAAKPPAPAPKPRETVAKPQAPAAKPPARATAPRVPAAKPKPHPKQTESQHPSRSQHRPGLVAPVAAGIGTPYHRAGAWASGYHTGIDFPVPTGTSVKAIAPGTVVSAGWAGAYGYQVVIRHSDGKYSQYAHLSALHVREGRHVSAGQRIARSGSTGNVTGPHLHFEIRTGPGYGSDIDPLAYLRAGGARV
ncbi:peptidoglycan DD-metalloendopeptidase family protein [Streptomyces sp. NPDC056061]|uniref:peptidoglycan DD-metalloendopeptidase family protein n=1 Tax=Streptomyces sp. NPDC056061 TaxID=3345700 RepID=UPI0035E01BED